MQVGQEGVGDRGRVRRGGGPETAQAEAGMYPKHYTDQTPLYEHYDYLVMPHFASQYRAGTESVAHLTYTGP